MTPALSPSECHAFLLREIKPSLRFPGGEVSAWQARAREKLAELIGLPDDDASIPLRETVEWTRQTDLGVVHKIYIPSERGADIAAYWCIPLKPVLSNGKLIPFICLQGHSSGMHNSIALDRETESHPIEVGIDNDFAIGCMKRGIAALCIEQRSFGLRREQKQQKTNKNSMCHDAAARAMMLGRTLVGERVYDVRRAVKWMLSREDVDPQKIGGLGHSGGGSALMYSASLIPELSYNIIAGCVSKYADSIATIPHCICNHVPGIMKYFEIGDVLGLIAPRTLLVSNGIDDPIFPIESGRQAFEETKKVYQACGAANACDFIGSPGAHRFFADDSWNWMLPRVK